MRRLGLVLIAVAAFAQDPGLSQAEALWRAHDYKGAAHAFELLLKAHPRDPLYKVRYGRLLLERFNTGDASSLFKEALAIDPKNAPALLGEALVAEESFEGSAADLAKKALASDPKLTEAHELLAKLALEDNDDKEARAEAQLALGLDSKSIQAEAVEASADLVEHQSPDEWLNRLAADHPKDGRGYELIGYFLQLNRRYDDGIVWFRKAVAVQPDLWSAHAQLGLNLMRLGHETEAHQQLELSFNNQYGSDPVKNTLKLMDTYKDFETFRTRTTVLKLGKKEAAVLRLYMEPEMEKAIATYQRKYEITLPRPVQLEVYPEHQDFAVRTMGMPGIGILGVTFQDVVAMDSPSGRPPGDFHWGATMWHELSHVYVLTLTNQRVPRWFTEGVAVHEETQASADWGDRLTPEIVSAIKDKKLLPISELDRGFIHPKFPNQVIVSYWQAGRICDFISQQWGEKKLLDMVHAFAKTDSTVEVVRTQLGITPEQFDEKFLAAVNGETKDLVAHFDQWKKDIRELNASASTGNWEKVIADAPTVKSEFPGYVGDGSSYDLVARYWRNQGNETKESAALLEYSHAGGLNPESLKRLGTLLTKQGKVKESAEVLQRLIYIAPLDEDLHRALGEDFLALNDASSAAREYRALIVGKSADAAAAHFGLARALRMEHKDGEAKDELLEALEAAPNFKPAQKMLLEMTIEKRIGLTMATVTTELAPEILQERVGRFREAQAQIVSQVRRVIVGQDEVIDQVLIGLFVGGHCLITGLPGTAKTLLVRTLAQTLGLQFNRIQFTPDLMPSDITGTDIIEEEPGTGRRTWTFVQGPIFANVLLADEINRTPPKTQSALLEAMQERACTVRGHHYDLPSPFFVLATQNPIELEGTYPLPEAQLDRFLFNVLLDYLSPAEELKVIDLTTTTKAAQADPVTNSAEILGFQQLVRMVPIADSVAKHAIEIVRATRPRDASAPDFVKKYINYGGSVRAAQFLVLAAKARSLMKGRYHVSFEDIRALAVPVLRHRVLLNFHAESDRLTTDDLLNRLIESKAIPKD